MAFDPPLPTAGDWTRDPFGSWGRLVQILNYRLDQYNAMGKDIPAAYARIVGYERALAPMRANTARQSVIDQLVKTRQALDEFVAKRNSVAGKAFEAINEVRREAARLASPLKVVGIGVIPVVAPLAIAVAGVAIYGITQLVRDWIAIKAQNDSLGVRVLQYGKEAGLTPDQMGKLSDDLSKLPAPKGPSGLFGELEALLPAALGIALLFMFGPTLAQAVKRRAA